jgi:nicotinamide-nucleotide amidase
VGLNARIHADDTAGAARGLGFVRGYGLEHFCRRPGLVFATGIRMRRAERGRMELDMHATVEALGDVLRGRGCRMATAESCTGGLVASTLTDVAGSSEWFEGGVVAYDNRIKIRLLAVPEEVLARHGAVSRECVQAMVRGVCELMRVPVGLAVSGIAGPGGGSPEKPVGTVWMAWRCFDRIWSRVFHFQGGRGQIKLQSVHAAIAELART